MSRRASKTAVVAFKVETELADILNKLPNKSAFIRKAIVAQLDMACPLCRGTGVLPQGLHKHFEPLLAKFGQRSCDGCGEKGSILLEPGEISPEDRKRLEQFFHGGPYYCDDCYEKAPACDDCGWHLTAEQAVKHHHAHGEQ
jgi:hypothetical protein